MNIEKNLQKLINKEKYQVFLLVCPASFPYNFAVHAWFVINKPGTVSRWEVLFRKMKAETRWGHLYKDFFRPFQGIEVFTFTKKFFWKARLLGMIEGEEARSMIEFIENSPNAYPYCDKYSLINPNSNSYIQWVLNNFPECNMKLPWNAFGKNIIKR